MHPAIHNYRNKQKQKGKAQIGLKNSMIKSPVPLKPVGVFDILSPGNYILESVRD